jgi:hypothetical protein
VERRRVAVIVGLLLACVVGAAAYLAVTALVLDSDSESVVGRVTSVQPTPSGRTSEVCVTEGSGRLVCAEATANFLEIGHVEVNDCVRVKIVRGSALTELFHVPCAAPG